jgi:DNA-binding response OmpR family regulator
LRRPSWPNDLLVADVQLPDLSGTHVAVEVLKHCPKMPVLFISGTPMEGWPERDLRNFDVLAVGTVEFLPKPFQASALAARVEMLLNAESAAAAAMTNR